MAEPSVEPTTIASAPEGLHIVWGDGLESLLPHRYLRGNCGCAQCLDEITHQRKIGVDNVPSDVTVEEYMEIGRYAIGLLFSDLHETGIYPFKYLRELATGDTG